MGDNLTDTQLEAADGSGALMIVETILSLGHKSTQEGARLLLDFFRLGSLRRNYGETIKELDTSIHTAILESWPGIEHLNFRSARKHSRYPAG